MIKECEKCKKATQFIDCESPTGFWICGECGMRTSFGNLKLIRNPWGFSFEGIRVIQE